MGFLNRVAKAERDYYSGASFAVFGVIVIAFGILALMINNKRLDYPEIDAEVIGVELQNEEYYSDDTYNPATYYLDIRYTVDGQEYETTIDQQPKKEVGDTVKIDYDPSDPTQVGSHTAAWFPYIIITAGVAGVAGGVISIIRNREKNRRLKEQEEEWSHGQNV